MIRRGIRWVCENHPDKEWPNECDCGAGMPDPEADDDDGSTVAPLGGGRFHSGGADETGELTAPDHAEQDQSDNDRRYLDVEVGEPYDDEGDPGAVENNLADRRRHLA